MSLEKAKPETPLENHSRELSDSLSSQELKSEPTVDHIRAATTGPGDQDHEWLTGFRLINIIGAVTLAIPHITTEFHSLDDIGWYGSAYQLASAAIQPLTGRVYASLCTKWSFVGFFAVFELGSLICGVATSSKMLIVGRAVAGMGASGILNGALTIIAACAPIQKRPTIVGLVMGVSQVGLAAGPLIGGALTQYTTWRWCFYINLPVGGLVAIMLAFVDVPELFPKKSFTKAIRTLPGQLDLIGFTLFAPSAIQLLLALQYGGNEYSWHSSQVIGLFCGAGATFIVFILWEYRQGDKAMIPFFIIRKRIVWSSSLSYGLLMAQVFCASWYLPIYFQAVKGKSPLTSGVYLLPSILAHLLTAMSSGKLVERVGYYLPFILISGVLTAIANGLLSTLAPHTSSGKWIGYQILLGAGRAIGMQMPIIAVQNVLPPPQIPVATALVIFSQMFAGALFLSFSNTILSNSLTTLIPIYSPSVNPQVVVNAGATGFRSAISASQLPGVLVAYADSVNRVFYLTVGMACTCFVFSCFMGWKDIRKKTEVENV
ncbi:major facilitator superfamily domain-containing protein [Penicillium angulare]|uniref:major facilitator superfamily domain-containing protein n=1 Tax=Penicillium angulare TaxID=116970 RepID=UPI00253FC6DC|nr:major facilitator superfamily domain-containing protein [Penicillium angulare]KAJ5280065.1 major facilitator superfamily domain-containing protein [Penicillium angulare]